MAGGASASRNDGFTLVEALAAFTILALFLVVLFSGIADAVNGAGQAQITRQALLHAKARLAAIGMTEPIIFNSPDTGIFPDGFVWSVRTTPIATGKPPIQAYWIEVSIFSPAADRKGRPVTLTTIKLLQNSGNE
jgi:type II secretory pathway pseudopilin PulG